MLCEHKNQLCDLKSLNGPKKGHNYTSAIGKKIRLLKHDIQCKNKIIINTKLKDIIQKYLIFLGGKNKWVGAKSAVIK